MVTAEPGGTSMLGTIAAVCTSRSGGIPKLPRTQVVVGEWGLEGDSHNRPQRRKYSTGEMVPNTDRHILIVAREVETELAKEVLGNPLASGRLAENITSEGLGGLSDLKPNDLIVIAGGRVRLRVVKQATPCGKLRRAYGLKLYQAIKGKRGVYCAIEQGKGEAIRPGDSVETISSEE
jgi:MOSC domain-containing protein YiiM